MHESVAGLIPELPLWNNGAGIAPEAWIGAIGRYDHAIGYAMLFWPDFALYDDCVFRQLPDPENYKHWLTHLQGDKTRVEAVMNHLHIADMFVNSEVKPAGEVIRHVGRLLKDMWSCKLKRDFPDRKIRVDFHDNGSEDLIDYEITLFQERQQGAPAEAAQR